MEIKTALEILENKLRGNGKNKISLELPVGTINEAGRGEIQSFLRQIGVTDLYINHDNWVVTWFWKVTGKGEYVGTFTKRLAKWLYQWKNYKISAENLAKIGDIAVNYCNRKETKKYIFDFTQRFDWQDGDFGDGGSCFWNGRAEAREMLEQNNAWAIRFYNQQKNGIGRCWVVPHNEYLVTFNGYGLGDGALVHTRVLAAFFGFAYKKIGVCNNRKNDGTLWINNGSGYAVGQWPDIANITEVDFQICDPHYKCCESCECELDDDNCFTGLNEETLCEDCFSESYFCCGNCGATTCNNEGHETPDGDTWCEDCFDRYFVNCECCGTAIQKDNAIETLEDEILCIDCANEHCNICENCDEHTRDYILAANENYYCKSCIDNVTEKCAVCNESFCITELTKILDKLICEECAEKYKVCLECNENLCKINEKYCADCAVDKILVTS